MTPEASSAQWMVTVRHELVPSRQPGFTSNTLNTHVHLLPLTGGCFTLPVSQRTKCTFHNWLTHDCGPQSLRWYKKKKEMRLLLSAKHHFRLTRVRLLHLTAVGFWVSTPLLPCVGKLKDNRCSDSTCCICLHCSETLQWEKWTTTQERMQTS